MARSRDLRVVISGDTKGLERAFAQVNKNADHVEKRMDGFGHKLGTAFKVAGAAAAGALVVGLKKSADAAIEAQKSQAKLEAQLHASNISYKAHAKQIDEVIQKTSKLAGLDDEDLQDAFTAVVRATGSVNTALKDMTVIADLARAKHMDVAKAGELVAKVHAGNVGALKRMGIAITPITAAQDKLKESTKHATVEQTRAAKEADKTATAQKALGELQRRVGGQAAAYGKTAAGAQDRFRVAVENLQERIGGKLLPVIARSANALSNAIAWTDKHRSATRALAGAVGALVVAFAGFVVVSKVVVALRAVQAAMIAVNAVMIANPIGLVVAAVAALGIGLVVAYKKSETFRNVVNGAFNAVKRVAGAAFEFIGGAARKGLLGPIPLIISRWGQVKDFFADLPHKIGGAFNSVVGILRNGDNAVIRVINTAISAFNKLPGPNIGKIGLIGAPDVRPNTGAVKRAPHQQGGFIGGTGRGDIVPAMLEPGEFVIRRRVVEKYGPTFFANINGGMGAGRGQTQAPGFQTGGIVSRANKLDAMHLPYLWGGGHGGSGIDKRGMDCSGAVSYALGISPRTSGQLMGFGKPGPGDITIFANPEHTFLSILGRGWGTSRENPGGGPGWLSYNSRSGFTVSHVDVPGGSHGGKGQPFREPAGPGQRKSLVAGLVGSTGSRVSGSRLGAALPKGSATTAAGLFYDPADRPVTGAAGFELGTAINANETAGAEQSGNPQAQIVAANKRRFQIATRINEIDAALKNPRHSAAYRTRLLTERAGLVGELNQLGPVGSIPGGGAASAAPADGGPADAGSTDDPNQPLIDALKESADATRQHDEDVKALKDEMKRLADNATSSNAVSMAQLARGLADFISGQIVGTGYDPRAMTSGAGALARY